MSSRSFCRSSNDQKRLKPVLAHYLDRSFLSDVEYDQIYYEYGAVQFSRDSNFLSKSVSYLGDLVSCRDSLALRGPFQTLLEV
jgi:hypothetical protein